MSKAISPHLRAPERVINISSAGARLAYKDLPICWFSKAAVEGMTRCVAADLGPQGHTVNTVNPGAVPTDLVDGISKEIFESRLGTTDDVAQVVGFLFEESSRWITRQAISASGGFSMY